MRIYLERLRSSFSDQSPRFWFVLVTVIMLATWLRFWQLDSNAIFFGDAARDVLAADQALQTKTIPLLGIPSSVPRFRQGPLSVWISMGVMAVAGPHVFPVALVFAFLSVLAVILLYEVVTVALDAKTGLLAATLLGISPLAIAHARMAYHITPIPLFTVVWLASVWWWWRGGKHGLWLATLSWALVFQFELAMAPLVLLIPYIWWRRRQLSTPKELVAAGTALLVGLAPQIVFDLTHGFQHLGGFALWVGYRLAKVGIAAEAHLQVVSHGGLPNFYHYFSRIVTVDQPLWVGLAGVALVAVTWQWFKLWRQQRLPPLIEITGIATLVLTAGYLVHGSPSEAYFPPYLIFLPVLISWWLQSHWPLQSALKWVVVAGLVISNCAGVVSQHFFVSNQSEFSYGPSVAEQRQVLRWLKEQGVTVVQLRTTNPDGAFPTYFNNFAWLAKEEGMSLSDQAEVTYFIESKTSPLQRYPDVTKTSFTSRDVYYLPQP